MNSCLPFTATKSGGVRKGVSARRARFGFALRFQTPGGAKSSAKKCPENLLFFGSSTEDGPYGITSASMFHRALQRPFLSPALSRIRFDGFGHKPHTYCVSGALPRLSDTARLQILLRISAGNAPGFPPESTRYFAPTPPICYAEKAKEKSPKSSSFSGSPKPSGAQKRQQATLLSTLFNCCLNRKSRHMRLMASACPLRSGAGVAMAETCNTIFPTPLFSVSVQLGWRLASII